MFLSERSHRLLLVTATAPEIPSYQLEAAWIPLSMDDEAAWMSFLVFVSILPTVHAWTYIHPKGRSIPSLWHCSLVNSPQRLAQTKPGPMLMNSWSILQRSLIIVPTQWRSGFTAEYHSSRPIRSRRVGYSRRCLLRTALLRSSSVWVIPTLRNSHCEYVPGVFLLSGPPCLGPYRVSFTMFTKIFGTRQERSSLIFNDVWNRQNLSLVLLWRPGRSFSSSLAPGTSRYLVSSRISVQLP